jgi:hypothetical protein
MWNTYSLGTGIARSLWRGVWVRFSVGAVGFSLLHKAQTISRAHSASYILGIGGFFLGGKAAGE